LYFFKQRVSFKFLVILFYGVELRMLTKVLRLVILKVILMVKLMSIDLRRTHAQREIRILVDLTGDLDKI
jgi:hypothetical protein